MNPILNNSITHRLVLKPGEQDRKISFYGSYVSVLTNSSSSHNALVALNGGNTTEIIAGMGFPAVQLSEDRLSLVPAIFQYIEFSNPSDEEMDIRFTLSMGTPTDTRSVIQGYLQVDLSAPTVESLPVLDVATDGSTLAIPADAGRIKERILMNIGFTPIWWGDSNVKNNPAGEYGLPITPGGTAVVNCHGAIFVRAEGEGSKLAMNNILKVAL